MTLLTTVPLSNWHMICSISGSGKPSGAAASLLATWTTALMFDDDRGRGIILI